MRKLTKRKVVWILRWCRKGIPTSELAVSQKVSQRRIQQILRMHRLYGRIVLRRAGRPRIPVPVETITLVLQEHARNSGAVVLEHRIEAKHHKHIPHNTIHRVLRQAGMAMDDPKKQKRRRWIRFERQHSLSLASTDWHESKAVPGKQVIAFLDDASRVILAIDEWDEATTENAIKTLHRAVRFAEPYGGICQVLSDHGTQFQKEFDKVLAAHGIEHIRSRVKHPQTNGKIERFFSTYTRKRAQFRTLEAFVVWYNTDRLHMSLKMHYAETPAEAFRRKMEPGVWLSKAREWFA